jgi:hypothetical protein
MPAMRALINEGLRQRQEHGVAAALPYFEQAAQIEPVRGTTAHGVATISDPPSASLRAQLLPHDLPKELN